MRRLVLFFAVVLALFAALVAFNWWIDPLGLVWKPAALAQARSSGCLISEELIGSRYWSFKRDVFFHRPTRTFVVGSSRVLKLAARPGEATFSNLGYPGTSPETILRLFRSLPARPAQTVYIGAEAFWFNKRYTLPTTDLSRYKELEYLLARSTFTSGIDLVRTSRFLLHERWRRGTLGNRCVVDRFTDTIAWDADGSRVWGWELDPTKYPKFAGGAFTGDLATWRNGYYADWSWDANRVRVLAQALDLAKRRGWHVVGFAPPEPPHMLHVLETDPRLAPDWQRFNTEIPQLFRQRGFRWADTEDAAALGCPRPDFPDLFHSDARCALRIRRALTAAR